ncbi:MAG: tetratricopeptide repeat protein [Kiritimatiellia bacterium]
MNFSLSSVRSGFVVPLLALCVGCGSRDGGREYALGCDAYAVRDLAKADSLLTASLERAPEDLDRLVALARVKLDLGELTAARELVTRAELHAGDGDTDVALLAAQIAWHAKDYKAAAAGFSALADNARLDSAVRAQALAGLGVVEMTCDNYHLARIAFLRAIRLDRRNAAAWYHLGLIYQEFGYLEAALEQFDIFVRLEEGASPRVQKVQRSVIPALKESIAQTAAERPGASRRNSDACSTAIARAEKELKKGSPKNARQAYQEALTADPLSYPAALGLARTWEKTDKTKTGQTKALEFYKLACALRPSAVSTFLTAGALALRLGYPSQAADIYSRAVAASPASLDALDGLIRALRKCGGKNAAAQAYQLYRESVSAKRK